MESWCETFSTVVHHDRVLDEYDDIWDLRPKAIFHVCAITPEYDLIRIHEAIQSVALGSIMARMLRVPFVYLTAMGADMPPATPGGYLSCLMEDQVDERDSIIRVNGLFGRTIPNTVGDAMRSVKILMDDQIVVCPMPDELLAAWLVTGKFAEPVRMSVGGNPTTFYDLFIDSGVPCNPWHNTKTNFEREYAREWTRPDFEVPAPVIRKFAREWYDDSRDYLDGR